MAFRNEAEVDYSIVLEVPLSITLALLAEKNVVTNEVDSTVVQKDKNIKADALEVYHVVGLCVSN